MRYSSRFSDYSSKLTLVSSDPSGHTEILVKNKLVPTLEYIANSFKYSIQVYDLKSFDGLPLSNLEAQRISQSDFVLQSVCRK